MVASLTPHFAATAATVSPPMPRWRPSSRAASRIASREVLANRGIVKVSSYLSLAVRKSGAWLGYSFVLEESRKRFRADDGFTLRVRAIAVTRRLTGAQRVALNA